MLHTGCNVEPVFRIIYINPRYARGGGKLSVKKRATPIDPSPAELFARFLRLTEHWTDVARLNEWKVSDALLSQMRNGLQDPSKMRTSTLAKLRTAVEQVERRQAFEAAEVKRRKVFEAAYVASTSAVPGAEPASLDHVLQLADRMAQLAQDMQLAVHHHRQARDQGITSSNQQPTALPVSAESVARGLAELVRQPAAKTKTPARRVSGRR